MDRNLIALKLFLNELGEQPRIETIDDRVRVQKATYLGQVCGADLGYRYSWYLKGPYSTALARDYYSLDAALRSGDKDHERRSLNDRMRQALEKAKRVLAKPGAIALTTTEWYELLASTDFLMRVSKLNLAEARRQLIQTKPHLAPYFDQAREHLRRCAPQ